MKTRFDPSLALTLAALAVGAPLVFTTVPLAVLVVAFAVRLSVSVRFAVNTPSSVVGTVTVFEVSPALNVRVPEEFV